MENMNIEGNGKEGQAMGRMIRPNSRGSIEIRCQRITIEEIYNKIFKPRNIRV
jgi:hypothetical protein